MLHKLHLDARMGPFKVPYADVKLCPTPDATATWQPVPHATMVETPLAAMAEAGFTVIDSAHAFHGEGGTKYFGLFHVRTEEAQDDYGLVIGLTNRHDKTMAARLGIGAGMYTDGQVLIIGDMLGYFEAFTPKFVKKYANLAEVITKAFGEYIEDVRTGKFPEEKHCYRMIEGESDKLASMLKNLPPQ